jgi:hypothetical protein
VQNIDPVGERHDQVHIMFDHDHNSVRLPQFQQSLLEYGSLTRVEASRRLIKQQHAGLGDKGTCDFQHALPAIGKKLRMDVRHVRQTKLLQQLSAF